MTGRGRPVAGVALAASAAVALGAWTLLRPAPEDADGDIEAEPAVAPDGRAGATTSSPFGVVEDGSEPPATAGGEKAAEGAGSDAIAPPPDVARAVDDDPVDLLALGREPIGDDEFERLAARLARDPALLQGLVDEIRSETDPERLERLLFLLGEVDDPAVAALAAELVYSGDPALSALGLDLLKRVRPGDPDAQAVVSGLLATETEARLLVPTLTALARPGATPAAERAALAGQVALLTDHPDPAVRRSSLDILSRWSDDATHTSRLVAGLGDEDPSVRRAAAFAFVGFPDQGEEVRRELFAVADDRGNDEGTRRGALLALKRMELGEGERDRVASIQRRLDTRPATR